MNKEIEVVRAAAVIEQAGELAGRRAEQAKNVEELIEFLVNNKDHIGGIAFVAIAFEDTTLVNTKDEDGNTKKPFTTHGLVQRICVTGDMEKILSGHLRKIINADAEPRNPLEALFGHC